MRIFYLACLTYAAAAADSNAAAEINNAATEASDAATDVDVHYDYGLQHSEIMQQLHDPATKTLLIEEIDTDNSTTLSQAEIEAHLANVHERELEYRAGGLTGPEVDDAARIIDITDEDIKALVEDPHTYDEYEAADIDKDGNLSRNEALEAVNPMAGLQEEEMIEHLGDLEFERMQTHMHLEMDMWVARFEKADADGDGMLTTREDFVNFKHKPWHEFDYMTLSAAKEAEWLVRALDLDGDGEVSVAEIESHGGHDASVAEQRGMDPTLELPADQFWHTVAPLHLGYGRKDEL